jgi:2-hydroxychromene-2-carboxylate isomerase
MASDIGLVLGSEHRDLLVLADQCGRASRGFHDPATDLGRRLGAHLAAADAEVYPVLRASASLDLAGLRVAIETVEAALASDAAVREDLARVARRLVDVERVAVVPALAAMLPIAERRRMGKVFRLRRDAVLRAAHTHQHRKRSQTELYEVARRAGLEHRSSMTQAQLQDAVERWERRSADGMRQTG